MGGSYHMFSSPDNPMPVNREACPSFGHLAQTSSITKYILWQVKIILQHLLIKLFQLSNGQFDIFVACIQHLQS